MEPELISFSKTHMKKYGSIDSFKISFYTVPKLVSAKLYDYVQISRPLTSMFDRN